MCVYIYIYVYVYIYIYMCVCGCVCVCGEAVTEQEQIPISVWHVISHLKSLSLLKKHLPAPLLQQNTPLLCPGSLSD